MYHYNYGHSRNLNVTIKITVTNLFKTLIICTINDFPDYGNLSEYSVKGHHACTIWEEKTSYI